MKFEAVLFILGRMPPLKEWNAEKKCDIEILYNRVKG